MKFHEAKENGNAVTFKRNNRERISWMIQAVVFALENKPPDYCNEQEKI
jgi:hypothetical protein